MTPVTPRPRVVIVGAGLAGSMMALQLGLRGYDVALYERRTRHGTGAAESGRSINLGLSARGLRALSQVGLREVVLERAVPAEGRVIHTPDGAVAFQRYGNHAGEVLYSILRNDLNALLLDRARSLPNVRLAAGYTCVALEKDEGRLTFRRMEARDTVVEQADVVVGADGAFSAVRQAMHRGERAAYRQEFLPWGYKELLIPPAEGGGSKLTWHALHVWPRRDALMVSHPNRNGSHTCTVFLPFEGAHGLDALHDAAHVRRFFETTFPDALPLMPDAVDQFLGHPAGTLVTTRTAPWHHKGRVVLVGDACHAVYPFYGQGMNAALEDCSVLMTCHDRHPGDLAAAFAEYQRLRKPNTDALADLAYQNFLELKDRVRSSSFRARKRADLLLNRLFPSAWMPLYTMVVHTTMPYTQALRRARWQDRLLRWLGIDLVLSAVFPAVDGLRRVLRKGAEASS